MEVLGFCHGCGKQFDAHWHNYPELTAAIMNPYCIYCKSLDVHILTDESNDPPDDFQEFDEEE